MIEQNVQVVRCQDDRLWVRMGAQTGCTACDNGNGCGAGLFAKLLQRKPVVLELKRKDIEVEAGQMLTLAFSEQVYLRLVLAAYGWPLLVALIAAYAGYSVMTWLEFGPGVVDLGTLICGLLAGGLVLQGLKHRFRTETVLGSIHTAVYFPSSTPNMCNRSPSDSTSFHG